MSLRSEAGIGAGRLDDGALRPGGRWMRGVVMAMVCGFVECKFGGVADDLSCGAVGCLVRGLDCECVTVREGMRELWRRLVYLRESCV